ncbi:MAG: hypothetical protein ACREE7_03180 [Dongiaceae bacterium]
MQRGQFAEAVPDGGAGRDAELAQDPQAGERSGDDRGLRNVGGNAVAVSRKAGAVVEFSDGREASSVHAAG